MSMHLHTEAQKVNAGSLEAGFAWIGAMYLRDLPIEKGAKASVFVTTCGYEYHRSGMNLWACSKQSGPCTVSFLFLWIDSLESYDKSLSFPRVYGGTRTVVSPGMYWSPIIRPSGAVFLNNHNGLEV